MKQPFSVRVIREESELESLRPAWESWQNHPGNDMDVFLTLLRSRKECICPLVFAVTRDGGTEGLLVARLEVVRIPLTLGYLKLGSFRATAITVIYRAELGNWDTAAAVEVLRSLRQELHLAHGLLIQFRPLCEGTSLLAALSQVGPAFFRTVAPSKAVHRTMEIPSEPGGFLKRLKSKHRSWIKRKTTELEAAYPNRTSWRTYPKDVSLEQFYADMETVSRLTYQFALGAGFSRDKTEHQAFQVHARKGQLRGWTLHVDDKPAAFWTGAVVGNIFHSFVTGYDPAFRDYEVGTLIFARMVDDLSVEKVGVLDFGMGDAMYKQRFGDQSWQEAPARIFAPTLRGAVLRLVLGLTEGSSRVAQNLLQRWSLVSRIKRLWREKLSKKSGNREASAPREGGSSEAPG